jgi:hypothetical protein
MKALKFAAALFFVACSTASATTVVPIGMLDPAVAPKSYVDSAIATEVTNRNAAITAATSSITAGSKAANRQVFTASGTWTKPTGFGANAVVFIEVWGGGGSGGRYGSSAQYAAGGGGGGYSFRWVPLSSLGATVAVTVGAGGAAISGLTDGAAGGTSSFGTWVSAYGGAGGMCPSYSGSSGGGGGGPLGPAGTEPSGVSGVTSLVYPGKPAQLAYVDGSGGIYFTGQGGLYGVASGQGFSGIYHGGGGGAYNAGYGGSSVYGGGGGGGVNGGGGASTYGGNGGNGGSPTTNGTAGTAPGGGGGGAAAGISGAGARGEVRVTVFDGA